MIDPSRNGGGGAIKPPERHGDGSRVTQRPWTDGRGRIIPPSREHARIIEDRGMRDRMNHEQERWDRNDHRYHWHDWDGRRVCHHYDEWGYHWWGFYIGEVYFWTRYYDDLYWWYDPYWHRWCWMRDGRWWWQNSGGVVYVIIDNNYYQYGDNGGTVVVTPDPTPPVEAPPADPAPAPNPAQTMFYSSDGTRFVQIAGDSKDAYLYDSTITDPGDPRSQGHLLASGVLSAQFVYDDAADADGNPTQVIRQIELTFADPNFKVTVDPNAQREVQVSGEGQAATLYNLEDGAVDPVFLASGVADVRMIDVPGQDAAGESEQILQQIALTLQNGTRLTFDYDGAPIRTGASQKAAPAADPAAAQRRIQDSAAFKALQLGTFGR